MLLRFPKLRQDSLRIFMHPNHVILLRIKRNNMKRVISKRILNCSLSPPSVEPNSENSHLIWQPALTALSGVLHDEAWANTKVQLVLSDQFTRYALIPWNERLGNQVEKQAYLRHCFQVSYGDVAKDWDLRMSDNGLRQASIGSGVDQHLLQNIKTVFEKAKLNLSFLNPHLMIAINQARLEVRAESYWIAVVESDSVCLALIQKNQWVLVKSTYRAADISQQLLVLTERESIACGVDSSGWPLVVYWPGRPKELSINMPGRRMLWIGYSRAGQTSMGTPVSIGAKKPELNQLLADKTANYEVAMWR